MSRALFESGREPKRVNSLASRPIKQAVSANVSKATLHKKERTRDPARVGKRGTVTMLEDVIKWLVPFLCGSAVSTILTYVMSFRALRRGVQCLLRAELIRCHEKYMAQGSCPVHGKEAAKREYNAYRALGGNDVATELYHQILSLPSSEEG